jgi:hypothetical protein
MFIIQVFDAIRKNEVKQPPSIELVKTIDLVFLGDGLAKNDFG